MDCVEMGDSGASISKYCTSLENDEYRDMNMRGRGGGRQRYEQRYRCSPYEPRIDLNHSRLLVDEHVPIQKLSVPNFFSGPRNHVKEQNVQEASFVPYAVDLAKSKDLCRPNEGLRLGLSCEPNWF
ncbi:hypothetical protein COLO4_36014 [Corchorus olitorius]|uniref:Uncharacterized protein n=1 Tax=Corchorus olitorius TaxID=93759 RepID=A0A1R3GBC3_9ROSI|nr:hypothetical protein COLO4_36014 [Corchorus olitorius]